MTDDKRYTTCKFKVGTSSSLMYRIMVVDAKINELLSQDHRYYKERLYVFRGRMQALEFMRKELSSDQQIQAGYYVEAIAGELDDIEAEMKEETD